MSRHFHLRLPKERLMSTFTAPRGTVDLLPAGSARWQTLEARIREIAGRFGYGEIRTPMFEATELFVRGVGETTDIVEKEMYTFADKGGRNMTLRPEWTAPVVRALLEHHLFQEGPQRLYYIGPIFRYERPQAGRYRQAHQFGVECFGFAEPEADVEVIQMAHELARSYGIADVVLHLNTLGDERCRPQYREALLAHFRTHREALSEDSQRRLERNPERILDSKAPQDRPFVDAAPTLAAHLCDSCRAHFERVRGLLDAIGILYVIDSKLVRGLDYYTRTVFEFVSGALGAQSTVCGGGRYDGLVGSLGGPATPGVGFGLGLERFLTIVERTRGTQPAAREGIAVVALGEAARAALFPLLAELRRRSGALPITSDYAAAKIQTQFKRADRAGARVALIAGDDELARGVVGLRDLATRAQSDHPLTRDAAADAAALLSWYRSLSPSGDATLEAV
jgi:histidyl-tRNA synthetase